MKRLVYLPQGRQVTLGNYVRTRKVAITITAREGAVFANAFNWYPETKVEELTEFRRGLHDCINWRIHRQIETYRAAIRLNQPRLIIHWSDSTR